MLQCALKNVCFAQLFLQFRDRNTCRKCLKTVEVSQYTDVLDKMFVHTQIEHSNVASVASSNIAEKVMHMSHRRSTRDRNRPFLQDKVLPL